MFKINVERPNSIWQSFRVECNNGSKYFNDYDKAFAYLEYVQAQKLNAELWLVQLTYDEGGELVKGLQKLLNAESDEGIVDFT